MNKKVYYVVRFKWSNFILVSLTFFYICFLNILEHHGMAEEYKKYAAAILSLMGTKILTWFVYEEVVEDE